MSFINTQTSEQVSNDRGSKQHAPEGFLIIPPH